MSDSEVQTGPKGSRWILALGLALCLSTTGKALPAVDLAMRFFEKEAEFKNYMQTPLRQKLVSEHNTGIENPPAHDASNWSGCQVGKGVLAGTFRDISACAASACYGRDVTVEEMKNLSYAEAERIIHWIWNQIHGSKIPNQDVANLTMHIQMQYGNIRIVQAALNKRGAKLRLSGRMDRFTLQAIAAACRDDAADTYNQIRQELIGAYSRLRGTYTFVRIINRNFPAKFSIKKFERDLWANLAKQMRTYSIAIAARAEVVASVWLA